MARREKFVITSATRRWADATSTRKVCDHGVEIVTGFPQELKAIHVEAKVSDLQSTGRSWTSESPGHKAVHSVLTTGEALENTRAHRRSAIRNSRSSSVDVLGHVLSSLSKTSSLCYDGGIGKDATTGPLQRAAPGSNLQLLHRHRGRIVRA